jgi:hypothetical protein
MGFTLHCYSVSQARALSPVIMYFSLYPLKLALTSPTSGGRSVGIVRLRTKAPEFVYYVFLRSLDRCVHGLCKKSETSEMRVVSAPVSGTREADLASTCVIA